MQNYMIGVAVFLFTAALAFNIYSYSLLRRSIEVMRFTLRIIDRFSRKEGTE